MKYLLLLVGFGWSGILLAQEKISVGFQGGINAPGLVVRSANPVVDGYKTKLSAYFGLMAEEGLSKKWSLVEEIDYANMTITKSGAQVIPRSAYDNLNLENVSSYPHLYATFDSKIQTKYIELPVMLKYSVYEDEQVSFYVNGGPFAGIMFYGNATTQGLSGVYKNPAHSGQPLFTISFNQNQNLIDWFHPLNFGVKLGAGLTVKGDAGDFFVNLNSSLGLMNIEESTGDGASKTKSLVLAVGYLFHLSK
jgi:hypothetical protein